MEWEEIPILNRYNQLEITRREVILIFTLILNPDMLEPQKIYHENTKKKFNFALSFSFVVS
jgi:hypothetical protein